MPQITYHNESGTSDTVTVEDGMNVMRSALANDVDGIIGECGGQAMCATCHIYVRERYLAQLPEIGEDEEAMLDFTASPRIEHRSRLGCQLVMGSDLTDLEVDVPQEQV